MRILAQWSKWSFVISGCFLIAASIGWSSTADAQIVNPAYVQAAANATSGPAPSFSLSFPASTAAGDVILVAFDYSSNVAPSSVGDTQGNLFAPIGNQLTSPGGSRSRVYYAKSIKGGADTVTVTFPEHSSWIELYLAEYSGLDQTNPVDAQAGASGNAGAVSSGSGTTTAAGDIIYGYCVADNTCTAGSGFAARSNFHGNLIEDAQVGSPAGYAATGSANGGWTMQMVALRPASTVGAVPVITSATSATGTVGTAFSYQISATNSPGSYGATGLPGGLSLNASTGLISGTPSASGTSTVTLSATNSGGTGNATLTLTIRPAIPVITSVTTATDTAGTAFSYQITATNTPTSYNATGLPAGLSVNTGTGLISGTPTTAGTSTVTLSATNNGGTGNATLMLTVKVAAPVITSATTTSGTVGTAFSYQITATNTPTSFGATGLPAGLSVNTGTGLISGTPTIAGTSTVTLSATNSGGAGNATLTLTVNPDPPATPVITSATTASGTAGTAFSYQISATNSPTTYGASGLPAGLSVNSGTGLISGTPTTAGTSTVALSATNAGGTGNSNLTVIIAATNSRFVQAITGQATTLASALSLSFPSPTLAGDAILVAFDYASNTSPSSVTDSQGNTFTAVGNQLTTPGGTRSRVYYARNIRGGADTVTINLSNHSAWIGLVLTEYTGVDPSNPIDAQAGASGSTGAVSSGNATTITAGDIIYGYCVGDWACSTGAGFMVRSTLNGNLIEDEVTSSAGSYAATGSATNGWSMQMVALKPASSGVGAPPTITSATGATGTVETAFSYQITATNTPTSYGAAGLPAGLSVNTNTGSISGTPTTAATSTVILSATNSSGTGNANLTLTVKPAKPVITSATTTTGTVGTAFSYQITATNSPTSYGATALPAGLSVNSSTGLISGTPTNAATSTVTLSATNSGGTGNSALILTVNPDPPAKPVITSVTTATGTVGTAFSYQITATNSPTSYGATGLPAGLSVNSSTGLISGTPTNAATSTVTLSATNSGGTGNTNLTLTVGASSQGQLMTLSSNKRYLVNSVAGQPVFVVGDDAFDLAVMLDSSQVTTYLTDRANRGFNAVWVGAADNGYQSNPPHNVFGNSPFDGADFTNEDATYWANVDAVVTQASGLGITVFLQPFFVGNGAEPGYYSSVLNSSDAVMTAYGTFLGNRYKGYNNIVWLLGGDSLPSVSGLYQKLNDVGAALAAADPNHLITLEACEQCVTNGYNSVQAYQTQSLPVPSWLGLNWAYPQLSTTIPAAQSAYTQSPFLPPLCGENFYELEHSLTELNVRFEQYSEVLSGCYVGRIFGNGAIWSFDSPNGSTCCTNGSPTWQTELSSPGSVSQQYQGRLFRSREHWLLVPDINHTVVTAGYGSGLTATTAARTSDGQTIVAYIPNGNATTITVAMNQITSSTSSVQGWWFNPSTAATTNLGLFSNSGTHNFTPPDSNDWVLVLDDANATLPAPGSTILLAP